MIPLLYYLVAQSYLRKKWLNFGKMTRRLGFREVQFWQNFSKYSTSKTHIIEFHSQNIISRIYTVENKIINNALITEFFGIHICFSYEMDKAYSKTDKPVIVIA